MMMNQHHRYPTTSYGFLKLNNNQNNALKHPQLRLISPPTPSLSLSSLTVPHRITTLKQRLLLFSAVSNYDQSPPPPPSDHEPPAAFDWHKFLKAFAVTVSLTRLQKRHIESVDSKIKDALETNQTVHARFSSMASSTLEEVDIAHSGSLTSIECKT